MHKLCGKTVQWLGRAWAQARQLSTASTDRSFWSPKLSTSISVLSTACAQANVVSTQLVLDDQLIYAPFPQDLLKLKTNCLIGLVENESSKIKLQSSDKLQVSNSKTWFLIFGVWALPLESGLR